MPIGLAETRIANFTLAMIKNLNEMQSDVFEQIADANRCSTFLLVKSVTNSLNNNVLNLCIALSVPYQKETRSTSRTVRACAYSL